MLESLITSRTRVKMLLKFFLNSHSKAHLRGLADEFGESTNSIRHELNNLSQAGYLVSNSKGKMIEYSANVKHPLYPEIKGLVHKYLGIDKIIDHVINKVVPRLGKVEMVFITGDYAKGMDTGIIDLVFIGKIDASYLNTCVVKAEGLIHRRIRTIVLSAEEFGRNKKNLQVETALVLFTGGSGELAVGSGQ